MRQRQCISSIFLFLALSAIAAPVYGQSATTSPPPTAALTPPKLERFVAAELTPEQRPEQPVEVVLELTVDEQGKVSDAHVVNSVNAALDAAALDAARRFEFAPARQNDAPVAVKIRYAYAFEPPAPPTAEPSPAEPPPAATADAPSSTQPANASAAPATSANDSAADEEFEATASVEAPPREVTRRSVDSETIRRIPGTRGDPLRAIEILPGVARTSLNNGTPILRGAAWNESQAYLNGTPVPFLYHFGGLTSFLSPRLVDKVDLYPGNFSVRYGRVTGGAIEVRTRDPDSQRLRAALDLNLIDSSAFVETPLGERAGLALAARRSNIDFVFKNFVPKNTYSVVAAPLYYDYQALGYYRLSSGTRLRVMGYGSRDSLEFLFAHPPDEDPSISGKVGAVSSFHRVNVELDSRPSHGVSANASVTLGRIEQSLHIGELTQAFDGYETYARAEVSAELHRTLRFTVGGDFLGWWLGGSYRGPAPGQAEGDPSQNAPFSTQPMVAAVDDSIPVVRPAAYVEVGYRPTDALLLLPGVRIDYYRDVRATAVDPRLAARYELSRALTLKAGVGLFSQGPEWWQALPEVGNPHLDAYRALQTSAGVESRLGEHVKLSVEGFYKRLYGTIVAADGGSNERLKNEGRGRIYGAELAGEAHWSTRGAAYLAYTLQRSERSDHGGPYRLFDQDQTHILALTATQGLGKGWELGARFRLVSGNPQTPITGAVYDARTGVYVPEFGALNSVRDPAFQQLDLRVEKMFTVGPLKLGGYLDLQNVYNAKNYESKRHSFDYKKSEAAGGLPFLPNIGLRGEL